VSELRAVPTRLIDASPDQNRETFDTAELDQLAASIRELGLLQPVKVRARGERYVLVAGERRLRAVRDILERGVIDAVVSDETDGDAALATLAENVMRVDPSPLEEAAGYRAVIDGHGFTPADVAGRVGVPAERVKRRLSLLTLSDEVRHYLTSGQLPVGRAERMAGLDANRQHLALAAHHQGISTDAFRALCVRLADEQSAESMFDPDTFLQSETVGVYVADAQAAAEAANVTHAEPLGVAEVAKLLDVQAATVHRWQHRGRTPTPDFHISGNPAWWRPTIETWARETGRLQ
jgi:ParB family chromosome partitioning protein